MHKILSDDPWEWRAVWMAGLGALQSGDHSTAQSSFNAVYGQLPGELAPKLALAVSCELGGESELAEKLYRICASTDATYVTPAAFGLARVRASHGDLAGSLAALELVPNTSRGYPESQRLKAHHLVTLGRDASALSEGLKVLAHARLDPRTQAEYTVTLYERAVTLAGNVPLTLGSASLSPAALRDRLEGAYRDYARLSDDRAVKAEFVDKANAIRPWSLL